MSTAELFPIEDTYDPGGRPLPLPVGVSASAIYGGSRDCYRYRLDWIWEPRRACLLAGMMNPSCATERVADRTLLWVHRWAVRFGFGRLIVVNADAYRCQEQERLAEVDDPCGPDNLQHIRCAAGEADLVVLGYGKPKVQAVRTHGARMARALLEAGVPLHVWGLSGGGIPRHPLYLPGASPAVPWGGPRD